MANNSSSLPRGPSPTYDGDDVGETSGKISRESLTTPSTEPSISNINNSFWEILEEEKNVKIPLYIKNIFKLNHLDNPIAFRRITTEALKEIEVFAREQMSIFLDPGENLELFYGQFHTVPEKFCFLLGDKFLLQNLVEFVQSTNDDFWKSKKDSDKNKTNVNAFKLSFKSNLTQSLSNSPSTLDINEERTNLLKLVKSIVEKSFSKVIDSDKKKNIFDKIQVTVSVSEIYEQNNLPDTYTYEAKIKCPLCSNESKLKKCGNADTKGSRWVLSNFRRHLLKHENVCRKNSASEATSNPAEKLRKFAYDKNQTAATSDPISRVLVHENNMSAINNETIENDHHASALSISKDHSEISASTSAFTFVPQPVPLKELSQNTLFESEVSLSTNSTLIRSSLDILQESNTGEC